jgi:hypothetical protein
MPPSTLFTHPSDDNCDKALCCMPPSTLFIHPSEDNCDKALCCMSRSTLFKHPSEDNCDKALCYMPRSTVFKHPSEDNCDKALCYMPRSTLFKHPSEDNCDKALCCMSRSTVFKHPSEDNCDRRCSACPRPHCSNTPQKTIVTRRCAACPRPHCSNTPQKTTVTGAVLHVPVHTVQTSQQLCFEVLEYQRCVQLWRCPSDARLFGPINSILQDCSYYCQRPVAQRVVAASMSWIRRCTRGLPRDRKRFSLKAYSSVFNAGPSVLKTSVCVEESCNFVVLFVRTALWIFLTCVVRVTRYIEKWSQFT